jgi:hypothetical protein
MRMLTAVFGPYDRLLNVMIRSAGVTMPGQKVEVLRVEKTQYVQPNHTIDDHHTNTYFGFIPAAIAAFYSTEDIAIADADLMFSGDIRSVFYEPFDLAFTIRNERKKYNTGLWFARHTPAAKQFIKRWIEITHNIYRDFHLGVVDHWGGIDQKSLADTIAEFPDINIRYLDCQEWNCCQGEWRDRDEKTKVIHIKSGLRKLCLSRDGIPGKHLWLKPLVDQWRAYDHS